MAKFALKKCSFWLKLHFYGANLMIFWGGSSLGALGALGVLGVLGVIGVIGL